MYSLARCSQRLGALLILASTWSTLTAALDLDLCASLNTAETPRNSSIYQTNGLCHDFCIDDYAYAITQKNYCWCSNYAPAKSVQESVSDCDTPCPAYPAENCGGSGLYGYLELGNVAPSGTQGASTSSTKTTAETTTAPQQVTETVQNTVTVVPSETTTSTSSSSSSSSSSKSTATSAEETSTAATTTEAKTSTEQPTSQVQTVTAGGTIKTVTIGPSETATSASENAGVNVKDNGMKTGQVVGIVVGVIVAVIAVAAGLLFFFLRRRRQQSEQQAYQNDPSIRGSSSGMMGSQPAMAMMGGSPGSQNSGSHRNSTLNVDPRMDPFKQGLYVRSGSRESINSLRDDHDYSRRIQHPKVLRATNPDPEFAA